MWVRDTRYFPFKYFHSDESTEDNIRIKKKQRIKNYSTGVKSKCEKKILKEGKNKEVCLGAVGKDSS